MKSMTFDELTVLYLNCHEAVREITGEYPIDYKKYERKIRTVAEKRGGVIR